MKKELKTPIAYYGGKQMMLNHILPKIPEHTTYAELFFGGGAVFWAKKPSKVEIINDTNDHLINFYKVLKNDFPALENLIDETFHSRVQHNESIAIYKDIECHFSPVEKAWGIWVQSNMSFANKLNGTFGYDRSAGVSKKIANKKAAFTDTFKQRLRTTTIESRDALKLIEIYDSPDTFFYLDPPYVSSNQGHYSGYTQEDFQSLLDACASMKGKFLLSSYPETLLIEYRTKLNWKTEDHLKTVSVCSNKSKLKQKTECLTWNYN